jgi:hypothetical protein
VIYNQEFISSARRHNYFSEPGEGHKPPVFSAFGSHRFLLTSILFTFYCTGDSKCSERISLTDVFFQLSKHENGSFREN